MAKQYMDRLKNQREQYQLAINRYLNAGATAPAVQGETRPVSEISSAILSQRSPVATRKLNEYETYKKMGGVGLSDETLKQLGSTSFYMPEKPFEGVQGTYNPTASMQAYKDRYSLINAYRADGIWDVAGNSPSLFSDAYLASQIADLNTRLTDSKAADEADKQKRKANAEEAARLKALSTDYYHMNSYDELLDVYGGGSDEVQEIVENWLALAKLQDENWAGPTTWDELRSMEDDEAYREMLEQLHQGWNNADWNNVGLVPAYESQTEDLQRQLEPLQQEQDYRTTMTQFGGLAESAQNVPTLEAYYQSSIPGYNPEVYDPAYATNLVYFVNHPGHQVNREEALNDTLIEDIVHDFTGINLDEDARTVQSYYDRGYNMLLPEEIAIINRMANQPEAIQAFLNAMEPTLLARRAEYMATETQMLAQDPWMAALMSAATVASGPVSSVASILGGLAGADPNHPVFDATRASAVTRMAVGENLGEALPINVLGEELGTTIYNVGMSMFDMLYANMLGKTAAGGVPDQFARNAMQTVMSSEVAANTIYNDLQAGYTHEQAVFHGAANGLIEAFYEKGFMDELFDFGKGFVPRAFGAALAEAGEEVGTEITQTIGNELLAYMTGRESEVNQVYQQNLASGMDGTQAALATMKHYGQQVALAGLSGFAMGGGVATTTGVSEIAAGNYTGNSLRNQGDVEAMLKIAESMEEGSAARSIAEKLRKKQQKGKKISNYDLGQLVKETSQGLGEEGAKVVDSVLDEAVENRLVELGEDAGNAKALAPVIRKITKGTQVKPKERRAVNWSDAAEQVVKELNTAEAEGEADTPTWTKKAAEKATHESLAVEAKRVQFREAMESKTTTTTAVSKAHERAKGMAKNKPRLGAKMVAFADSADGQIKQAKYQKVTKKHGNLYAEVQLEGEKGPTEVAVEDLDNVGSEGLSTILNYAAYESRHDMSAEEVNAMAAAYELQGGDVDSFVHQFEDNYLAGYSGIKEAPTDGVGKIAYEQGRTEAARDEETRLDRARKMRSNANPTVGWLGDVDTDQAVKGQGDTAKLDKAVNTMTEGQQLVVEFARNLSANTGLNVALFRSKAGKTGNYNVQNGSYDASTHTIYLDINAGVNSTAEMARMKEQGTLGYAIMRTMGHEVTHAIEATSTQYYDEYKQAVKKELTAGKQDWAQLVRRKLDNAIANGQKLTYAAAEAEVVADASEYMLQDSQFVQNMDAGLKNKVKRIMQDFMGKIRAAFKALTGGHAESMALRTMRDGVMKYSENLQKLWDEGFMEMASAKVDADHIGGGTGMVQYSPRNVETEDKTSIKDQLRTLQAKLNTMDVVASVHAPSFDHVKEKDRKAWAINELKSSGYKTDVKDFGIVEHGEKEINNSLNYLNSSEEIAAFACIPRVLKRGVRTSGHENHKGRNYTTVTFAAPVEINGVRGNMAVVVKQTSKNHYKTHRVLMPDGSAFVYNDNKKTEPTPAGGIPSGGKAQATHISSATGIVPQSADSVNRNVQKSVREQGMPAELASKLGEIGIPYTTYDGTDADRLEKLNAVENVKFSRRDADIDGVSIREYLGAMKATERMTETEKVLLKRYQENLRTLEEKEKLVAEQEEIIRTAPAKSDELTMAKNRYQIYRTQANRAARALMDAERSEGFARLMATSQEVVNRYLLGSAGAVGDAADVLDEEIAGLTAQLKAVEADITRASSGQRAAFARGLFDQVQLNAAAQKLKDTYGSRMSVKAIADRLALAYGEIYADKGADGAKRFMEAAHDLAGDLLRNNKYRYKSEILPMLAEQIGTISLSETDVQEIRNAGMTLSEYKRMLSPYIKVTQGGSDLSSYASNALYYGEGALASVLGDTTEGDLAMRLYEVISQEKAREAEISYEGMSEGQLIAEAMADIAGSNLPVGTGGGTIEYLRKELLKYAGESAEAAQKVEQAIMNAQAATRRASGVWRAAVQEVNTAKQAVEYYRKLEEQRRLTELKEQKQEITGQLRSDYAKKLEEKVQKQREEYRAREQKAREYRNTRAELEKLRRRIGRNVKRLNTLRMRETDQKHVPQELKYVADAVMQTFTDSSLSKLAFSAEKTASLARRYRLLQEIESDMTYYWDDEIEADIENLQALGEAYTAIREREGGVPSVFSLEGVELETEILQGVDNIVSNVLQMIDSANDAFLKGRTETFNTFANQTGNELLKHDDAKVLKGKLGDVQMAVDEWLRTGNVTPVYFFDHLRNGRIKEVYDEIRRGQTEYGRIIHECQTFMQETRSKYHYGSWADNGKLTMTTSQGHKLTLTKEQAMWIYATAKREQSNKLYKTEHLAGGGFQYKDTSSVADGVYRATDKPHTMNEADVAKVGKWLTDEQKAYADEVVGFLSNQMADYGNEASMAMFGYKKFTEKYYFPFQTKADQRFQKGDEGAGGENAGTGRVKNSGFTKKLQNGANATLLMDDFSQVAADHMQKMATYAAMVQPIENMKRLMNHKVIENDGTIQTIRALIGQKYGRPSERYMQDFLKDLNGATQGDNRATTGVDYLIGSFKRGAVLASASVVLQQPTAAARAMAYINPKYFRQNPFYRPSKGTWEELMKYSGTAIIKDMGKFDVGLGLTASEYIMDEHLKPMEAYHRLKGESKLKGGMSAAKRAMDWLTSAPGAADQWTWGLIWKAVKAEQAALNPKMNTSSEEFLQMCGQRFDDVIDHTQVYDSVLTRSGLMRSKNALHKMATSFMSEPTLSINMLYDMLVGDHSKGTRWAIFACVMASQVLAGAMAALVQAWNDDDDKRNWAEKYADRAASNILSNINPLGMIPYISDVMSMLEGYDVERPDMSTIKDLMDYTGNFFKKAWDPEQNLGWKDYENFIGTWANMLGVPAKNISRELRRAWNAVTNTDWSAPDGFNVGQVMLENLPGYDSRNAAYYERIVAAELRGDTQRAEDYREYMLDSKMVSEDAMKTGLKKAMRDQYIAGNADEDTATKYLMEIGVAADEDEAYWEIDSWKEMRDEGIAYSDYKKYGDFYEAIESGENLKAVIREYTDHGVAKSTLSAQITNHYKEKMIELYATDKREFANLQARLLTAYAALGYDRADKLKDIQKWLEKTK